jgi:hypothetical protein
MFLDPLDLRGIEGTNEFFTLGKLRYQDSDGTIYEVPPLFRTDLASIPRILWSLVGAPNESSRKPAVLHDYLCRTGIVSRKKADQIFERALKDVGSNWFRRKAYYIGVRIGAFFGIG